VTTSTIILEPIAATTSVGQHPSDESKDKICIAAGLERHMRERHWTMLFVALFIVIASCFFRTHENNAVRLPWSGIALPPVCGSRLIFGIDCPGCGLTRSFVALGAGDLSASLRYHRVGWLMALAVVAQIPYRIYGLLEMRSRTIKRMWPVWFGYFLVAALILNWLLKMGGI
jgi:hypothetical protein